MAKLHGREQALQFEDKMKKFYNNIAKKLKEVFECVASFLGITTQEKRMRILAEDSADMLELDEKQKKQKQNTEKRKLFEFLLEKGIAYLHFDPRVNGVRVPDNCRNQEFLALSFSYRYHVTDFAINEENVISSLTFQGIPFQCIVPWNAVYAIADAQNRIICFDENDFGKSVASEKIALSKKELTPEERRKNFKVIQGGINADGTRK